MRRDSNIDFPELRRVFSGYLHEDFLAECGTPAAALRRFWTEADPIERRRFQEEAERFLAYTAAFDLDAVRRLVRQLGGRWSPPSRDAVIAALTGAADPS